MRRAILSAAALAALALPTAAHGATTTIAIPGMRFVPAQVTIVAGDDVQWRNSDFAVHTATASDGSFASPRLANGASFTQRFDGTGQHPYYCTIHAVMRGEVDVVAATLRGPGTVVAGESATLAGRTTAGTPLVTIQQQGPSGAWTDAAAVTPAADGSFSTTVAPAAATTYRVLTSAGTSPTATVGVSERLGVTLGVRHGRRSTLVRVTVDPAAGKLVASLQRYSRWRYAFRTVGHTTVDAHGRASFRLRRRAGGRARVVLSRAPGGPAVAISRAIGLRTGKPVVAPGPGAEGHAPHGEGHGGMAMG